MSLLKNVFNITDFGAIADGKTDCTIAIQKAIDVAEKVQGTVYVPSGVFLCGQVDLKPFVTIEGYGRWTYRENGGSVLSLCDDKAGCLINMTNAYGAAVKGVCLQGNGIGDNIHGIATLREDEESLNQEDGFLIDGCRISGFSGDGIRFQRVWCYSVRHSQLCFNQGNGLYMKGWDAFISDCWFSHNEGAGVCSDKEISAVIFTANRVEENFTAGLKLINPINVTITGNAFDSNGGPALDMNSPLGTRAINISVVGNNFHRSGMPNMRNENSGDSCHLHIFRAMNCVVQSNVFYQNCDNYGNRQTVCPKIGMIIGKLKNCIIKDNVMMNCATDKVFIDRGQNDSDNLIEIKGSVKNKTDKWIYPFFDD